MKYDLVFEGGGAKGIVFSGALKVFESLGHTPGRLLGTSAGAITATGVAAGYTAQEILDALSEKVDGHSALAGFLGKPEPFTPAEIAHSATRHLFRAVNLPLVPDVLESKLDDFLAQTLITQSPLRSIFSFIERGGWYSATNFLDWMAQRLDSGTYKGRPRRFSHLTLAEFYDQTLVDLSLIASDTTAGLMLILNHRTAPDLPVVWAVRMSMSVPLLWAEVVWLKEWGLYRGRDVTDHTIVDGGILSNFPIELFISHEPLVTNIMGPNQNEGVLGMLIDETLPVPGAAALQPQPTDKLQFSELRTVQRLNRLLDTTFNAHDKMVVDAFAHLVVHLPAQGYAITEFDMSDERRDWLVSAGQEAMQEYFSQHTTPVSFALQTDTEVQQMVEIADKMAVKMLSR
ncbi:MAG: patatin-like phospholipase family protein [Chloroflexi bacterium]|nr:patatin-like phospholipase family protein [Chloroflexota bacterium]